MQIMQRLLPDEWPSTIRNNDVPCRVLRVRYKSFSACRPDTHPEIHTLVTDDYVRESQLRNRFNSGRYGFHEATRLVHGTC